MIAFLNIYCNIFYCKKLIIIDELNIYFPKNIIIKNEINNN